MFLPSGIFQLQDQVGLWTQKKVSSTLQNTNKQTLVHASRYVVILVVQTFKRVSYVA